MAPGAHESADKRTPVAARHGNKWLTSMLVEAAGSVGQMKAPTTSAQHARLTAHRGMGRAQVTVAHFILVSAHWPQPSVATDGRKSLRLDALSSAVCGRTPLGPSLRSLTMASIGASRVPSVDPSRQLDCAQVTISLWRWTARYPRPRLTPARPTRRRTSPGVATRGGPRCFLLSTETTLASATQSYAVTGRSE